MKDKYLYLIGITVIIVGIVGIFISNNFIGIDSLLTSEQIKEKYPNSICFDCDMIRDPFIDILLIILLPIIALIGIILIYLNIKDNRNNKVDNNER